MDRVSRMSPFIVMDILREAQRLKDVVHMEIGEPDLDPPPGALEELQRAIRDRKYFYTPALGLMELREKVSEFYYRKYGVEVSPSRIAITTGTSGAFLVAYAVLMNEGDKVILPDPSYPCYKNFAHLLDITPEFIPVGKESGYQILPDMLVGKEAKAIHVPSPANPTGNLYEEEVLKTLIEKGEELGLNFISDEIYHGLVYEGKEHTALEFSDEAVVINGFSKYFCMPGFRLGWVILPERLMRKAEIVIQNVFISAPTLSQYAALGAFDYEFLERVRQTYRERREVLYSGLKELFDIDARPQGAFYLWAKVDRYCDNSYEFCMRLLKEAKVATTPGIDFGQNNTEKYVRFSYTKDTEHLKEGIRRLREYLS